MTAFQNLRCVAIDGTEAPLIDSHPDYPYGINWYKSKVAKAVRQSRVKTILWDHDNVLRRVDFDFIVSAVLVPDADLVIVTLHYSDPSYIRPRNAVAINPVGTLNHQITPPAYVEITAPHSQAGRHVVESIGAVSVLHRRALLELEFRHQWTEQRHYDPINHEWNERAGIYRK